MHRSTATVPLDEHNLDTLEENCSSEAKDMVRVFLREHPNSFSRMALDDYVHDDGRQEVVLKLIGGVSIVYGGGHYKLPASVILPQTFPVEGPIVYMNPNETMVRNTKSPYVDANFMVCTDYIERWQYPFSNLCHMYEDMKAKFSKAPPLKNKNKSAVGFSSRSAVKEPHPNSTKRNIQIEGLDAMKTSLAGKICSMLNAWLESEFEDELEKFSSSKEQHRSLQSDVEILKNEREELDGCISEFANTIRKLDTWHMHEEHKSSLSSSLDFQQHFDAYDAILPTHHSLNDMLESDACIHAVNDAISNVDEALLESRIGWKDYKKILSQLAHYKFQAKILNNEAKKGQNKALDSRIGTDSGDDCSVKGYPLLLQTNAIHIEEDLDLDNPLKSI